MQHFRNWPYFHLSSDCHHSDCFINVGLRHTSILIYITFWELAVLLSAGDWLSLYWQVLFINISQYNVNQLHKGGTWYIVYDKYTRGNGIRLWHRRSNVLSYASVFCVWKGYVWEMCKNPAITKLQSYHNFKYLNNSDLGLIYIY